MNEVKRPSSLQPKNLFIYGDLVIDLQRHLVTISGERVNLSPTEFDILTCLTQKAPEVVSPQELMESLYDYESEAQEASAVIRNNIYRIRSKLREVSGQENLIRTVHGVGYALQTPKNTQETDLQILDGHYRLIEFIGQGAMAKVYKAYQEGLNRYVAIKILRTSLIDDDVFQERFLREARHIAALHHPNIVQVYDYGNKDGDCYIVMEFIEGETLESKLSQLGQEKLPMTQCLEIIRETGRALAYAHQQGMIHRDIKPGNIMLTPRGRIVLMDFGLAKLVAASHKTAEGQISGTPNYMSPEQIGRLPIDARVDIYSLGVVFYQLITGRLPFPAESNIAVLFKYIKEVPPLPSIFVSDLAAGIEYIILKAMAKHPDDRYQTMDEMLTDLAAPERVAGTIEDILPALKAKSLPPHYLPTPMTSFVQRSNELNAIQSRLMNPDVRLLTLLGVGGVGKTRLALEVAKNLLATFSDGVFFIDLSAVKRPSHLPGMIAHLVNMSEEGEEPIKSQLLAYLSRRQLLLVFDNFEHILEAGSLASEILTAAPQCKILTTSREPLRLYGENLIRVAPLPLPDLRQHLAYDELRQYAAVQLFAIRAQSVAQDFELGPDNVQQVAEICIRLDGLPLALELAASQVYGFTPAELLAQLKNRLAFLVEGPRDRPVHQQTMRGAIDWSYDLLDGGEKRAFSSLGIFAGSFSAEAAVEIVGDVDLEGLVQKGLLQQEVGKDEQPRYWMLQMLREYALENLAASQEMERLEQKHTAYYLSLSKTAEPHLTGPDQDTWLARLEEDHDNFRAVLHRSLEEGALEHALQLGAVLWRLWAVYSYLSEGPLWLETLLSRTSGYRTPLRAKVIYGAGRLALFQQKLARASQLFNESLDLYRELQDLPGQATLLNSLGEIALQQAAYDQAGQLFEKALSIFQDSDDKVSIRETLTNLGQLALQQRQYKKANSYLLRSLEYGKEVGTTEAIAIVLNGLGEIARMQSRYDEAASYYERSLAKYRQLNYSMGQAASLHNLGQVKLAQERFQEAVTLFRQSLRLLTTMEEKVLIGWNLAGLGAALLNLGNAEHAVRLFSATEALFQKLGGQLDVPDQVVYEHYLEESKKKLPEPKWRQAWLEGQTMPVENELLNVITLTPAIP